MPYEIANENKKTRAMCGKQSCNIVFNNFMHALQDNPNFATTDSIHSTQINIQYPECQHKLYLQDFDRVAVSCAKD